MDFQIEYFDDGTSFKAIDPIMINPEYLNTFSIYERFPKKNGQYRFQCLITEPDSIPRGKIIELLKSWETVYVHKKQHQYYQEHIRNNLGYILKHDGIDIGKKTQTLTRISTDIIKDVFSKHLSRTGVSPGAIGRVEKLISQAVEFMRDTESLDGLADLIGHDYDTHTHSLKVGWLMATFINANRDLFGDQSDTDFRDFIIKSAVAGLLHDIGKIKIPENILNKKDKLNNLEYITVQSHTAYSLTLLFGTGLPKFAMQAILYHHENEDGSGYPCGLKKDRIPLIAKIIHIIDVFEALTSERPYKKAKTPFEALRIMTGTNPHIEMLNLFEEEIRENKKVPVETIVRNEPDIKIRTLREKQMMEEEIQKRVEARLKLRDQGMSHCFDMALVKRFIRTINQSKSFDLDALL